MKNTETLLLAGLIILAIYGILQVFNKQDSRIIVASQNYEKCVWINYNMTPSQYLEINGEYPVCK